MIKDQFLYFAQYPSRDGVLAMFTNGSSESPGYNDLVNSLKELPETSRIPEIRNYVYVDYGELDMLGSQPGSFRILQRIAVTVACKMPNRADAAEYMLASNNTLLLLARLHAWMLADADAGNIPWLSRGELDKAEIVPFVASELHAAGWTLMLSCIAPDTLDTHRLMRSFARQL